MPPRFSLLLLAEVDAATQALTVTTFGIRTYGASDLAEPISVTARRPFVVQRFEVQPSTCGNGACDPEDVGVCPEECAQCGNAVCDPYDDLVCPEECNPCLQQDGVCDPACGGSDPDCAQCVADGYCAPGCDTTDPDCPQ